MIYSVKNTEMRNHYAKEWFKCRANPFYFIFNYVHIQETGGVLKYDSKYMHNKIRRVIRSIYTYNLCVLMASRQLGKALSVDTPIPMADGTYTKMADIKIGDQILDGNGNLTSVIAATDVMYDHDCYRIEFDNDEVIICDKDHLWNMSNTSLKIKNKILTAAEIFQKTNKLKNWKNPTNFNIDLPENVNYGYHSVLPIHPYYLGLWLGDGTNSQNQISCDKADYETYSLIFNHLGYHISELRYIKNNNSGRFTVFKTKDKFRKLNLLNNKHIPTEYLTSSIHDRLSLLRGLMDSDGHCMKCGTCQFYQKDLNLLKQVRQLLSSLGIKSKYRSRIINNEEYHQLTFTTSKYRVFNLHRKYSRQNSKPARNETKKVYIRSINPVQSIPVRCIQVSNSDGMFLCSHSMIPTHNSTIAAALLAWALVFYPKIKAVILNMKQDAGLNNLAMVRFIIEHLPPWMVSNKPFTSKSEIKTYIDLFNGSNLKVFYPSTVHSPSTLARSLSVPILYID